MNYEALAAFAQYKYDEVLTKPARVGGVLYKAGDTVTRRITLKANSSTLEETAKGVYLQAREVLEKDGFECFKDYLENLKNTEIKKQYVEKIFELAKKTIVEHFQEIHSFELPSQAKEFLEKTPGAKKHSFFEVAVSKNIPSAFAELAE